MQVEASNRLKLLWSKAMVVSVKEKVLLKDQVSAKETNKPEPLWKCRNRFRRHQNQGILGSLGSVWKIPVYCPDGGRHEGGVNLAWASVGNVGTFDFDVKGEIQVEDPPG